VHIVIQQDKMFEISFSERDLQKLLQEGKWI